MRNAFAKEIREQAIKRNDIVLLSGDIGNRMFDSYKEIAPERFINCGIAEANMMSLASGMALSGLRPVVYTITPFTTTRCLEQIKIGAAYHNASILIIGTGSGLSYSELGPTHHSFEDIAILRSIPNLRILAPSDSNELIHQMREALVLDGPTYIRIGKKGEPNIFKESDSLGIGKANLICEGSDFLLIGTGPIINEAIIASNILKSEDIELAVLNLGSVSPLDEESLRREIKKNYKAWIVLEEHSIIGGLGSSILDWLNDINVNNAPRIYKLGIPNTFIHNLGKQAYIRKELGIDVNGICKLVKKIISD